VSQIYQISDADKSHDHPKVNNNYLSTHVCKY